MPKIGNGFRHIGVLGILQKMKPKNPPPGRLPYPNMRKSQSRSARYKAITPCHAEATDRFPGSAILLWYLPLNPPRTNLLFHDCRPLVYEFSLWYLSPLVFCSSFLSRRECRKCPFNSGSWPIPCSGYSPFVPLFDPVEKSF
jgi:hypothetical protein